MRITACLFAAALFAVAAPNAAAQDIASTSALDTLILLDGSRLEGTITAIDERGRIAATGIRRPLDVPGLRGVERPVPPAALAPALLVHLAGGGVVRMTKGALEDDAAVGSWAYGDGVRIPAAVVRAVHFAGSKSARGAPPETSQGRDLFAAALAKPRSDQDQLLVVAEGKVQSLSGLVRQYSADGVSFEWEGETRTIAHSRVYGIVLAQLGPPHDPIGECTVRLRDGSSPSGKLRSLADGKLTLELAEGARVVLPFREVAGFSVRSDRLAYLSDLTPLSARTRPIVTLARPWRADRSVTGGPLRIGNRTFEKGLGVQSHSELTFAQGERFDAFAATVGIDVSAAGRGDCEFVVLADGKEVLRQRMRGADPPKDLRVSTAGARQVTLVVEPGEDLDLSDHADWCDARFVKTDHEAKP